VNDATLYPFSGPSTRGWSQQDLMVCPQAWAFARLLSVKQNANEALVRGGLVHEGAMHYWLKRAKQPHLSLDVAVERKAEHEHANAPDQPWLREVGTAQRALAQYAVWCDTTLNQYVPWGIEHAYECWFQDGRMVDPPPDAERRRSLAAQYGVEAARELYALGAPWLSTGRADLLAAYGGMNMPMIIDWKTGWKLDAAKRGGFTRSGQFMQYWIWGRAAYGANFGGVKVGFINLSYAGEVASGGARPKKSGGYGEPFSLFDVVPEAKLVMRFPWAVQDRAEQIAALLKSGRSLYEWPRVFSEQGPCTNRYGTCPYWSPCASLG
jgi:hypothetical protein